MSAEAARQALEQTIVALCDDAKKQTAARCFSWAAASLDNADRAVRSLVVLYEQASPGAVVGVGADGYTFADGSTPQARDDDAELIEALEDAGKLPDEWEHSAQLESARAHDDSDAKVAVYRMCARELRAALAAARAGETPA